MAAVVLSAITGAAWSWFFRGIASPGLGMPAVLAAGAIVGAVLGGLIRPFRHADPAAQGLIALIGLFGASFVFALTLGLLREFTAGPWGVAMARAPFAIGGVGVAVLFGVGLMAPLLWPLAIANHALVWWLHRRAEATKPSVGAGLSSPW